MQHTVTLTATQAKAMSHITESVSDYIQNFASNRGDAAINDISQAVIRHCFANGIDLPATQDAMIDFAFDTGLAKTAEQIRIEAEAAARAAEQTQGA